MWLGNCRTAGGTGEGLFSISERVSNLTASELVCPSFIVLEIRKSRDPMLLLNLLWLRYPDVPGYFQHLKRFCSSLTRQERRVLAFFSSMALAFSCRSVPA